MWNNKIDNKKKVLTQFRQWPLWHTNSKVYPRIRMEYSPWLDIRHEFGIANLKFYVIIFKFPRGFHLTSILSTPRRGHRPWSGSWPIEVRSWRFRLTLLTSHRSVSSVQFSLLPEFCDPESERSLIFVLRSLLRDSSVKVDYRLDPISKFGPRATAFGNFCKIDKNLRIYTLNETMDFIGPPLK